MSINYYPAKLNGSLIHAWQDAPHAFCDEFGPLETAKSLPWHEARRIAEVRGCDVLAEIHTEDGPGHRLVKIPRKGQDPWADVPYADDLYVRGELPELDDCDYL
jgi:hypothetical protein